MCGPVGLVGYRIIRLITFIFLLCFVVDVVFFFFFFDGMFYCC